MTNLEALDALAGDAPGTARNEAAEAQLRRALEALEAVEVLDAWAERNHAASFGTRRYDGHWLTYSANVLTDDWGHGESAHAARIAAAAAVKERG